jgi:NAD(P)H dehydrogenase (quinone)
MYGHIKQLADAEKKGAEKAGITVDIYQIKETLPDEVLTKMHAPPKASDVPVLPSADTLEGYDGFLFGIPTRYGNFPAQWKVSLLNSPRPTTHPLSLSSFVSYRGSIDN